jgi:hypothetical protein
MKLFLLHAEIAHLSLNEISRSCGCEHEDDKPSQILRRVVSVYFYTTTPMMEAVSTCETSVYFYENTRRMSSFSLTSP